MCPILLRVLKSSVPEVLNLITRVSSLTCIHTASVVELKVIFCPSINPGFVIT